MKKILTVLAILAALGGLTALLIGDYWLRITVVVACVFLLPVFLCVCFALRSDTGDCTKLILD